MTVYARLGVRTVVNARGNATLAGGTLMEPEVVGRDGRGRAVVRPDRRPAGGRSARIAAADRGRGGLRHVRRGRRRSPSVRRRCSAGLDPDRMERLPRHDRPARRRSSSRRVHRNPYDHLVRAPGARLVEFGGTRRRDGRRAEPRRSAPARPARSSRPGRGGRPADRRRSSRPPTRTACRSSSTRSVNLPPRANLRRFIAAGADLVAFSGGKTIRGPQASGFLAGRADLLISVGLQQQDMDVLPATWARRRSLLENGALTRTPIHGIGRSMKTGKEEIVGLLVALERYADPRRGGRDRPLAAVADRARRRARGDPGPDGPARPTQCRRPARGPMTIVTVDPGAYGLSAVELVRRFAAPRPDHHGRPTTTPRRGPPARPREPRLAGADEVIAAFVGAVADLATRTQTSALTVAHDRPPGLDDVARTRPAGAAQVRDRVALDGDQVGGQTGPDRARRRRPGRAPAAASDVIVRIARHGSKPRRRA